jgi:hypothetical protein
VVSCYRCFGLIAGNIARLSRNNPSGKGTSRGAAVPLADHVGKQARTIGLSDKNCDGSDKIEPDSNRHQT